MAGNMLERLVSIIFLGRKGSVCFLTSCIASKNTGCGVTNTLKSLFGKNLP